MQQDATNPPVAAEPVEVVAAQVPDKQVTDAPFNTQPRRGGFVGLILGGVIAAIAGFVLAQVVPDGWPTAVTNDLTTQMAAQDEKIGLLEDQLATVAPVTTPDPDVITRLTALESKSEFDPQPLTDRIAALEARFTAIEKLPADGSGASAAAVAALQADMQALRDAATKASEGVALKSETVLQEAESTAAESSKVTEALAAAVRRLAALGQLRSALDTGAPFAEYLVDLASESTPVPAVLAESAESGLPTLPGLRLTYPPAARLALDAALRANMGESWSERATSFLRSQTGARSLNARDGTDPDAVLSRAEAALNAGNLTVVLTELQSLSPEAQLALADWRAMAQKRLDAEQAISALAATIGN